MKKRDLLANVLPEEPNEDKVIAGVFFVERRPVLELSWIDTNGMEKQLVRHFVWRDHFTTYRGKLAYREPRWTVERYETALNGPLYSYYSAPGEGRDIEKTCKEFLEKVNSDCRWIYQY